MAGKIIRKKRKTYDEDGKLNIYVDRSWSEQTVQRVLDKYFEQKKMYYLLSNAFIFGGSPGWESDFFFISKNRHTWEIEIKVDRQDFHREFKKTKKHRLYKDCYDNEDPGKLLLPNNYFFCAPEGVIPRDQVPEYAGLMEVYDNNKIRFVGERPKLHEEVQDIDSILLKKFYNKARRQGREKSDLLIELFENPNDVEEIVRKYLKKIRM